MTLPLKTNDPQLSSSVQSTLASLLRAGIARAGRHCIAARDVQAMRLTATALRELVSAGIAEEVATAGGRVIRQATPVAQEVEFFANGDIAVTLAVDLA